MRTMLCRIPAALALCGAAAAVPATPAAAHTAVCAGTGSFTLADALTNHLGPYRYTDFVSWTMTGTCSLSLVSGSIQGWCNDATGTITLNDGTADHTGSLTWLGPDMVFSGGITGAITVTPAPGETCFPPLGADSFAYVTNPSLLLT